MKWMCLDLGERRIGVALSDPAGIFAQPHATLEPSEEGAVPLDAIREIIRERGVEGIVVGLPVLMDGTEGTAAKVAQEQVAGLREALGIPVETWDERLSSVEADRFLVDAGVRRSRRREVADRVAAALILQAFLDRRLPGTDR